MTTPSPTRLPIPGAYQLTMKLSDAGQLANVVLGFRVVGETGEATVAAQQLKLVSDAAWMSFRFLMHTTVEHQGGIWRYLGGSGEEAVEVSASGTPTGTLSGTRTVAAACTLVKWSTGGGGRSGKGRSFFPGLTQEATAGNGRSYTGGHGSLVTTRVGDYLQNAAFDTAQVEPAVLSFTKGQARPIVAGALAGVVGLQRRRMRG